jgi:hypothetical protein
MSHRAALSIFRQNDRVFSSACLPDQNERITIVVSALTVYKSENDASRYKALQDEVIPSVVITIRHR